jgi:hypothetical protein
MDLFNIHVTQYSVHPLLVETQVVFVLILVLDWRNQLPRTYDYVPDATWQMLDSEDD